MRVRVAIRDKVGKDFYTQEQISIKELGKNDTLRLAERTKDVIKEVIDRKAEHPTGKLASTFEVGEIPNGHGVGDISQLDRETPYWNHIDKGSEAIGANWKHVLPKGYWANYRWVSSQDGYWFIPTKPIPAMNYIADTVHQMESEISKIIDRK